VKKQLEFLPAMHVTSPYMITFRNVGVVKGSIIRIALIPKAHKELVHGIVKFAY
jgi:hypothetical protein